MRVLIWSNAFTRSLKRWMRKRPGLQNDINEVLKVLVVDPFVPQLETHKLKGKLQGHGHVVQDTIYASYSIL